MKSIIMILVGINLSDGNEIGQKPTCAKRKANGNASCCNGTDDTCYGRGVDNNVPGWELRCYCDEKCKKGPENI